MTTPISLGDVPLETLERILDFLDAEEAPSSCSLLVEPSKSIYRSEIQPLKCLSLTCAAMRKIIIPRLFGHLVLKIHVQVGDQEGPTRPADIDSPMCFFNSYRSLLYIKTVVIEFILLTSVGQTEINKGFAAQICGRVMDTLKPQTLRILTPPSLMPYLAIDGYSVPSQDEGWAFDAPLHVLSCERSSESPPGSQVISHQDELCGGRWFCWSSMILNEGSSIKCYSSYEYFHKRPPSLLRSRHVQRLFRWNLSETLRKFEYIAIFPIAPHIREAFRVLQNLHCLEVLSVQFGPHASSEVLSNVERLGKCQLSDLWMEFRECYVEALRFVSEMSTVHRLNTFRPLDWSQYASQIPAGVEEYMPDWTFDGSCFSKPITED